MSAGRKRLRRIIGPILLISAIVAYLHYNNAKLDRQIAVEEARLAALGVRPKPPQARGGGRFLRYFTVLYKLQRVPWIRHKTGSERANLKLREPLLREIRRLTGDRDAPLAGTWENLGFGRVMVGLVQMAAVNRLEGNRREALDWLRAALRFAEDYRNDETRPDVFTARIDENLAWEAGALLKAYGNDVDCLELVRKIRDATFVEATDLVSDRYWCYGVADAELAAGLISWVSSCSPAGADDRLALQLYNTGTTRKNVRLRMLTCLRRQAEAYLDLDRTADELTSEERRIWDEFSEGAPTDAGAFAAKHLFPQFMGLNTLADYHCRQQVRFRILDAGLFVTEQTAKGARPTRLPDDVRFRDPFSGQTLVYRPLPSGFRIYSVGYNGIDDGGYGSPTGDDLELGCCFDTKNLLPDSNGRHGSAPSISYQLPED